MSRPRHASSHSRGSSPFGDRKLSITEATFQGLHLNESAGSQSLSIPSSYPASNPTYRRPPGPQSEVSSSYLQSGYDHNGYRRDSPVRSLTNPLRASPAPPPFGISDPEPLNFPIGPATANFHPQPNPSDPAVLRANMR